MSNFNKSEHFWGSKKAFEILANLGLEPLFKELNRILRRRPRPTHREEVTGVGRQLIPIAMPSGLAFGSAMVELFF